MQKEQGYYVIRSLNMMNYLVMNGFPVVKVVDSDKNPEFKSFMFMDSYEFRQCMSKFKPL